MSIMNTLSPKSFLAGLDSSLVKLIFLSANSLSMLNKLPGLSFFKKQTIEVLSFPVLGGIIVPIITNLVLFSLLSSISLKRISRSYIPAAIFVPIAAVSLSEINSFFTASAVLFAAIISQPLHLLAKNILHWAVACGCYNIFFIFFIFVPFLLIR